jgi:hypothetical protein
MRHGFPNSGGRARPSYVGACRRSSNALSRRGRADLGGMYTRTRQAMRELAKDLLWPKKQIAQIEAEAKREIKEQKAQLSKAESAVEAAKEGEGRALEAQARADADADELSQTRAEIEEREAHALSQAKWSKAHAEAAQRARQAAEEKAAQAEAAARSEVEGLRPRPAAAQPRRPRRRVLTQTGFGVRVATLMSPRSRFSSSAAANRPASRMPVMCMSFVTPARFSP